MGTFDAASPPDGGVLPDASADGPHEDAGSDAADAPVSAASCLVLRSGNAGIVLRGMILTPSGPAQGEVFVDSLGKIACAGASCSGASGYSDAALLTCPRAVIAPGLINPHVHLDFASAPPYDHGTTRWEHRNGWRKGTGGEPMLEPAVRSTDVATNTASELRHVLAGVTTVSGSGGVVGLARNLASVADAAELGALGGSRVFFDTFPLGDSDGLELSSGCDYPSIRASTSAFSEGFYAPHVAEGINGAAENEFSCLKSTLITSRTAIIHGVGLDARDVADVRTAGASVVWSPRSNIDLYGNTTPVTEFLDAGVTVALGTDWLPTGSMNLLRELACVRSLGDKYFPGVFDAETEVAMVTSNAARALGWNEQIGSLAQGLAGDIAVFDARRVSGYEAVVQAGVEDVLLVLRAGRPLYGDAALVSALRTDCSALPVCGVDKQVCLDVSGVTLESVLSAADASYPLFFCKDVVPTLEPSCVPYRDTYPNGSSATDRDGDGVPDEHDNCPTVFNPVRPMDGSTQANVDGDTLGDACDPDPLVP